MLLKSIIYHSYLLAFSLFCLIIFLSCFLSYYFVVFISTFGAFISLVREKYWELTGKDK
jgi:hypothetical protein